jgi:hypothetical protein
VRNRQSLFIILAALLLGLLGWWLWRQNAPKNVPPSAKNLLAKISNKNPPVSTPATAASLTSTSSTNFNSQPASPYTITARPPSQAQPPPPRNEVSGLQTALDAENSRPIDVYGKVVDQHGQPVAGVDVKGGTLLLSPDSSGGQQLDAETDNQGQFSFIGLHGARFGVLLEKPGYESDPRTYAQWWDSYKPDPNNPFVFKIWKLQGAEPMVHSKIHDYIPCDGTEIHYDLATGKKVATGGELVVKLTRNPVDIVRGKPFDWQASIEIVGGGLTEMTDLYPYEAPADGYKSTISITREATAKEWSASYDAAFYFKTDDGKVYGRMTIKIQADFQPPPTLFNADIYANPAGSRNLEYDPEKTVKGGPNAQLTAPASSP